MPHPAEWSLLKFTGFPFFIDARGYLLPSSFPLNFLANFVETRDDGSRARARL
jgi:hypothetical protein